ncbi:hypothetical protein, partial [Micromonospora sp. RP3T]|uniref:hypothetical protein n=1 Tax=Micromonospora sp. RP3T TaxID=2135446 RepID=UPI001E3E0E70
LPWLVRLGDQLKPATSSLNQLKPDSQPRLVLLISYLEYNFFPSFFLSFFPFFNVNKKKYPFIVISHFSIGNNSHY